MPINIVCKDKDYDITSEDECKRAGTKLGFDWGEVVNGSYEFPACFKPEDGFNKVYFNKNLKPVPSINKNYSAICRSEGKHCAHLDLKNFPSYIYIYIWHFVYNCNLLLKSKHYRISKITRYF